MKALTVIFTLMLFFAFTAMSQNQTTIKKNDGIKKTESSGISKGTDKSGTPTKTLGKSDQKNQGVTKKTNTQPSQDVNSQGKPMQGRQPGTRVQSTQKTGKPIQPANKQLKKTEGPAKEQKPAPKRK